MSRAKYCTTELWAKDKIVRDSIMKKHDGYDGQKIAEKYVEDIFGGNRNLSYLKERLNKLHLNPDRIAKRMKTMLMFWIYDHKELVEKAIAMEKRQDREQSCVPPVSDENDINLFDSFDDNALAV